MKIVWTVLPNGLSGANLQLSVLVSPRIDTATLPAEFVNWPTTVQGLTFAFTFQPSGTTFFASPVPLANAALWTTVFGGVMPVTPFAFKDNSTRPIWSYPVAATKAFIDSVYAAVQASSAKDHPSVDPGLNTPLNAAIALASKTDAARVAIRHQRYDGARAIGTLDAWRVAAGGELGDLNAQVPDPSAKALYLARRFYDRPASAKRKDPTGNLLPIARPQVQTFDFHQRLALLSDHPFLLRKLGIILDFSFQADLASVAASSFVFVRPMQPAGPPFPNSITPRTAYDATAGSFIAKPSRPDADVRNGMLALDDARFAAVQGETDGDVQKLVAYAVAVDRLRTAAAKESATGGVHIEPQALPARRSAGFLLARRDRAGILGNVQADADTSVGKRFAAAATMNTLINAGTPNDLYAEDLVRGFRVDVRTSSSSWASLQRRRITYSWGLNAPSIIGANILDESYVKAASATSDPGNPADPSDVPPPDMYLHEGVCGWAGWSLAIPRPGRRMLPVYSSPADAIDKPTTPPSMDFPLNTAASVEPGSLIPLRFGYPYSFRARVVDLAGNSFAYDDPTITQTPHATQLQIYKRYEPIPPPPLVPRAIATEGESVEHMVIRSGDGKSAAAYAQYLNTTFPDSVFPAKQYLGTCERHVAPPKTTQAMAEAHGEFDGAFAATGDKRAFYRLGTREEGAFSDTRIASLTVDDGYNGGNPNQAAIITPPQVPMDLRRTASGGPDVSTLTANRGDALAPGEYVVCAATDATLPYLPDSAAGGAVFFEPISGMTFTLNTWQGTWPDYQPFRLVLTDGPSIAGGAVAGRVGTITLPPATILTLRYASTPAPTRYSHLAYTIDYGVPLSDVIDGRHWMLTPFREIKLVHAVPRPLAPPSLSLTLLRSEGATWVDHSGTITTHSNSTDHVDLEATWQETLDLPTKPLPDDGVSSPTLPQHGHVYQVAVAYGIDSAPLPALKHELGDTRHRVVKYTPVATTRYREYFPASLTQDPANISLAGTAPGPLMDQSFSIPSAARPAVPKIAYVVPTFKWEKLGDGSSVRRGGGLRIYIERPWYSSGEGELLGVLLAAAQTGSAGDPFVSKWGKDPVWGGAGLAKLEPSVFQGAERIGSDVKLAENGAVCDVIGHKVEFNPDRRLWFCDVQIDPGHAYFPFVGLSVARYQPQSLAGLELSPSVHLDFAQLTPTRTLDVAPQSDKADITVTGPILSEGAAPPPMVIGQFDAPDRPTRVFVGYLQERDAGSVGDMGWTTVGAEVGLREVSGANTNERWIGEVPLPPASGKARRIVVEEREFYVADAGGIGNDQHTPAGRVVYIDTWNL